MSRFETSVRLKSPRLSNGAVILQKLTGPGLIPANDATVQFRPFRVIAFLGVANRSHRFPCPSTRPSVLPVISMTKRHNFGKAIHLLALSLKINSKTRS